MTNSKLRELLETAWSKGFYVGTTYYKDVDLNRCGPTIDDDCYSMVSAILEDYKREQENDE